jgi:hypothetical protein
VTDEVPVPFDATQLDKDNIRLELAELPTAEVQAKIDGLYSFSKTIVLAELHGEEHTPAVLFAFAELAKQLSNHWIGEVAAEVRQGTKIVVSGNKIQRAATWTELYEEVVDREHSRRLDANWKARDDARKAVEKARQDKEMAEQIQNLKKAARNDMFGGEDYLNEHFDTSLDPEDSGYKAMAREAEQETK